MKLEYTNGWFRVVLEIFHSQPEFAKYRVVQRRKGEERRRRMLRRVIRQIGKASAESQRTR